MIAKKDREVKTRNFSLASLFVIAIPVIATFAALFSFFNPVISEKTALVSSMTTLDDGKMLYSTTDNKVWGNVSDEVMVGDAIAFECKHVFGGSLCDFKEVVDKK